MKNLSKLICLSFILLVISCKPEKPIVCEDDCQFLLQNETGTMIELNCFSRFGIQTIHPDDGSITIYGMPDSVEEKFKQNGKEVKFTAKFRVNTLEPEFPDPSFSPESIYQIELIGLEEM